MKDQEMQPNETFIVNLDNTLKYELSPSYLKYAILCAKERGYYSLNDFVTDLSREDLSTAQAIFDKTVFDHDERATTIAILVAVTIAQLEGLQMESTAHAESFVKTMAMALSLEGLHRIGFVEFDRKLMSFSDIGDMKVKVTAEGIAYQKGISK